MPACASPSSRPWRTRRTCALPGQAVAAGSGPRRTRGWNGSCPGTLRSVAVDVRPGLDGIDGGLRSLGEFEARGVRVLNPASALIAAHDKLVTARLLQGAGLPHPRTWCVTDVSRRPRPVGPVVVKPRFESWGRDVARCADDEALARESSASKGSRGLPPMARSCRSWSRRVGTTCGSSLPEEAWSGRSAVSRPPGSGAPTSRSARAARPSTRRRTPAGWRSPARRSRGLDLAGVDLLPVEGGWVVLELNGAVDFTSDYSRSEDVFRAATRELARTAVPVLTGG